MRRVSIRDLLKRLPQVAICRKLTRQWFPVSLAYLGIHKLHYPFRLQLRTGEVLILHEMTDVVVFWLVFVRHHYPVASTDKTIVDIGANIGVFTLYAARAAPSANIVAVEPFPDTCERLREMLRLNQLEQRVTVVNSAITGSSGVVQMDVSEGVPSQYRSVLSEVPQLLNREHKLYSRPDGGVPVTTITLDELLSMHRLEHVDLVKMNIHGNEYEVLLSSPASVLRRFERIALQYHDVPENLGLGKQDLFRELEASGFHLVSDADTGRGAGRAVLAQTSQGDWKAA